MRPTRCLEKTAPLQRIGGEGRLPKTAPIETDVNQSAIIPALVKGLAVVADRGPHLFPDPVGHPH